MCRFWNRLPSVKGNSVPVKDCCSRSIQHAVLLSLNACLRWLTRPFLTKLAHLAGGLSVFTTAGLEDARGLALLQSRELP